MGHRLRYVDGGVDIANREVGDILQMHQFREVLVVLYHSIDLNELESLENHSGLRFYVQRYVHIVARIHSYHIFAIALVGLNYNESG